MYVKLKAYKEDHGNINMSHWSHFDHNKKLGRWCHHQRLYYNRYRMGRGSKANYRGMCRERIQLMEAIGFKWKVSNPKERSDNSDAKNEEEDDDGNDNLKPKAKKDSTTTSEMKSPPSTSKRSSRSVLSISSGDSSTDVLLDSIKQREKRPLRAVRVASAAAAAVAEKNSLSLVNSSISPLSATTNTPSSSNPRSLRKRQAPTVFSYTYDDYETPTMKKMTPSNKHNSNNKHSDYKDNASLSKAENWDDKIRRLTEFKRIHGHCDVPRRYVPDMKLGKWVDGQRSSYKKYQQDGGSKGRIGMGPSRIKQLQSLGFRWSLRRLKPYPLKPMPKRGKF